MHSEEEQQHLSELQKRGLQLHRTLERLLAGVTIPQDLPGGDGMQQVQQSSANQLREVLATFLVQDNLPEKIETVWDILVPYTLQQEGLQAGQVFFSQRLEGTPAYILTRFGYNSGENPLRKLHDSLRRSLTPSQNQLIPVVVGRAF